MVPTNISDTGKGISVKHKSADPNPDFCDTEFYQMREQTAFKSMDKQLTIILEYLKLTQINTTIQKTSADRLSSDSRGDSEIVWCLISSALGRSLDGSFSGSRGDTFSISCDAIWCQRAIFWQNMQLTRFVSFSQVCWPSQDLRIMCVSKDITWRLVSL